MNGDGLRKELDVPRIGSKRTLSLLLHFPGHHEGDNTALNTHWKCLQELQTITLCTRAPGEEVGA